MSGGGEDRFSNGIASASTAALPWTTVAVRHTG
jgi:hypothetical protein